MNGMRKGLALLVVAASLAVAGVAAAADWVWLKQPTFQMEMPGPPVHMTPEGQPEQWRVVDNVGAFVIFIVPSGSPATEAQLDQILDGGINAVKGKVDSRTTGAVSGRLSRKVVFSADYEGVTLKGQALAVAGSDRVYLVLGATENGGGATDVNRMVGSLTLLP